MEVFIDSNAEDADVDRTATYEESDEHFDLRNDLIMVNRDLQANLKKQRFSLKELQELNIHVQPISLDKTSSNKPCFFAPRDSVPPLSSLEPDATQELQDALGSRQGYIHPDGYSAQIHRRWQYYVEEQIQLPSEGNSKQNWPWFDLRYENPLTINLWLFCWEVFNIPPTPESYPMLFYLIFFVLTAFRI